MPPFSGAGIVTARGVHHDRTDNAYRGAMSPRLSVLGLVVQDMARALAFYRELGLDIPAEADMAPHVDCTLPGGMTLAWDTRATVLAFDPGWQPPSGGHAMALCFTCDSPDDVDAVYARMVAAGHTGHKEPWNAVWRQRYAILHDPDGHQVELFAPLD
jgi:catechol 2,3-dioxygenase-like lactoylglutathione lyase family enzyme